MFGGWRTRHGAVLREGERMVEASYFARSRLPKRRALLDSRFRGNDGWVAGMTA